MKKREERFYLDRMLEKWPELQVLRIVEDECPDFILTLQDRTVGVELTQFFYPHKERNTPPQVKTTYIQRFRKELEEEHRNRDLRPLYASIVMRDSKILLHKKDRESLSNEIFALVQSLETSTKEYEMKGWEFPMDSISSSSLSSIRLRFQESLGRSYWSIPEASFLPHCTPDLFQEVIDTKNQKLENYTQAVDEHWLVILAGTHGLHSSIDHGEGIEDSIYESEFDRVFIYNHFGSKLIELKKIA